LIRPDRPDYFPRASAYAGDPADSMANIRDPRTGGRSYDYSERHLQAIWFDPRWRPAVLLTSQGEEIRVESPGLWNLEAGPDFTGAAIEVGPDRRRITGDVEIHVFPSGWKQHGHDRDPRYRSVCLHITYFEGTVPAELLPPGALQIALRPALQTDSGFAFEHIDVSAYPYAGRAEEPPCRNLLSSWPIERRAALLDAAGHARLKRKADRFFNSISTHGVDQVLYESFLVALGYQHNKVPFARLASAIPVEVLRRVSEGREADAYAILAGVSGLLPDSLKPEWDEETRTWVRLMWDAWWKVQSQFPVRLGRDDWTLKGLRPLNHPLRRMMAAARLFSSGCAGLDLINRWVAGDPAGMISRMEACVSSADACYWRMRSALGGRRSRQPISLLGRERWSLIGLNVVVPLAAACGYAPDTVSGLLAALDPEPENQVTRQMAFYLLGRDHPSWLLDDATRRQGLQQIFHDYCVMDRSRCRDCRLPARLSAPSGRSGHAPA